MIIGWGADQTAWAFQLPDLSREFRCVVFDNRGSGGSDQPDTPYTTRLMAEDTVGLMNALRIDRAHLLGLSMGGMIAQEIAINQPDRVRTLQLHATLARPDAHLAALINILVRAKATFGNEEFTRALLAHVLTPKTYRERPDFVELLARRAAYASQPTSLAGFSRQAEACMSHDSLDRLQKIPCPTLITVGADDVFVPLRFSRVLQEGIRGSELIVIGDAGHGYLWEEPDAFNRACLAFLRKLTYSS
jgi:pimeloyl-ACP methyl ester carboxylesterase